jgi:autotransporter-associated beta strand protein
VQIAAGAAQLFVQQLDASNTFSLGSYLQSSGGLVKAGNGTLSLTAPQYFTGTTTVNGGTGASLYGSILAGAESTSTGPAWLAAAATPASFTLTSSGDVTLAGATAVAGVTTITAPTVTITAAGGVISRGNLSITANGTEAGQGLFSSGLLVAGGTVNAALTALTPSTSTGTALQ